jgi:glycosyltransferase involved in cell wall biosynthesis
MSSITALLHTHNDALRLGRALEMLFPCDEIIVIDHGSEDATRAVAREYGARFLTEKPTSSYLEMVRGDWILSLDPRESITEALAASLFEWKSEPVPANVLAFSIYRREETPGGWIDNPIAQTRLVRADWNRWAGNFPEPDASAVALEGDLLRFVFP